jgi:hypothetical protein
MKDAGKVPIRESAGAALRFLGDHWRTAALVGAVAAAAQTFFLLTLGAFSLPFTLLAAAGAYGYFLAMALDRPNGGNFAAIAQNGARIVAAMSIVGFLLAVIGVVAFFVATSVLMAPYAQELQAAGENEAAVAAIAERAMLEQPGVTQGVLIAVFAVWFWLTSRLYLAAPATLDRQRITVFESWVWTRGNAFGVMAARFLVLAPAAALLIALQLLAARAVGFSPFDLQGMANAAAANPLGFVVFFAVSQFLQVGFFGALEAGLSAYLHRGLKPADAGVNPRPSTDSGAVG